MSQKKPALPPVPAASSASANAKGPSVFVPPASVTPPPPSAPVLTAEGYYEPAPQRDWMRIILYSFIIIAAGFFVAAPAFQGTWLWDDDQEISANIFLRSWAGFKEIWKGNVGADYLPIKTSILWIEYHIWELNNVCFHFITALFHVVNALLVWNLLSRLKLKWAWVGGLLFAIHPALVESVGWVSEQKNTISLIFMIASIITFINYDERRRVGSLIWSVFWFIMAALSKSAVIMLPACLFLYLWWKHDSIRFRDMLLVGALGALAAVVFGLGLGMGLSNGKLEYKFLVHYALPGLIALPVFAVGWWRVKGKNSETGWRASLGQLASLTPFVIVSVILACITVYFQFKNAIGAETIPVGDWEARTVISGISVFFYLYICIWPFDLIPIYPRWDIPYHPSWWMYLPWLGVLLIALLLWRYRKSWGRPLLFGLGFFFINLIPVMGFITMSYMRITWVADHFIYISVIGIIGLVVAGAALLYDKIPKAGKPWAAGVGVLMLAIVAWNAFFYSDHFLNESNMWEYTLSKNANAWQAHSRYGKVLLDSGRTDAAFYHIQQSNRLRPDLAETNNNMGVLLLQKKRTPEALYYFRRAVRIMPIGAFLLNYANAVTQAQVGTEAAPAYERLIRLEGGQQLSNYLKEKGRMALEQLYNSKTNPTLGDVIKNTNSVALQKTVKMKAGDAYDKVMALKGSAALQALIQVHSSETLDEALKAKSVENLEKLVREQGGQALENLLKEKSVLDPILKMDGGNMIQAIFHQDGGDAIWAFRGARGSDAYEALVMMMRPDPLAFLYTQKGGEQLKQLFAMTNNADCLGQLHDMESTDVYGIITEMMGGDATIRQLEQGIGNPMVLTNYGVSLLQCGRLGEAINALQTALRIQPGQPDATRNLELATKAMQQQQQAAAEQAAQQQAAALATFSAPPPQPMMNGTAAFAVPIPTSTGISQLSGTSEITAPIPAPAPGTAAPVQIPEINLNK